MSVPDEKQIIPELSERLGFKINSVTPLTGGSINNVLHLTTSRGDMVLKVNSAKKFPGMFPAEKTGLETLADARAFDVPEVYDCGELDGTAYLLIEFKQENLQKPHFWEVFGEQLARLHQTGASQFGFTSSNYIGSLPQYNDFRTSAADFYVSQRLEPQVKMALERGFSLGDLTAFYRNISNEIPGESPALIHGDLWNGNYLINEEGLPCLIDPAVNFGPREMDLAMMKLFGGFPEEAFETYNEHFPLQEGWEQRIPIWQLYYLLVHLNIFGSGYLQQVKQVINRFS